MTEIVDFLRSIPDVIWSAVIASALTLSGILISNRSSTARLRIQLHHDAAEKSKERAATLRREVYLQAVEELTRANSHLASLPQKDPTKENLAKGLQGFLGAAAKLQLVAEPKTALLVNQLVAAYSELTLKIMGSVLPLHRVRADISIHDELYDQAQAQVNRVLSEMANLNESGKVNQFVFGALQRSFESFQAQASEHADNRGQAWKEFNRLNIDFCKQLVTEMRAIGQQQIPVLVEIRRDLGLTTELEAFREQMERQWLQMSAQLEGLLRQLQTG